jgi:hypothetical protein
MNTSRKFWIVLVGAVLALAVIACSCGSLGPLQNILSTATALAPQIMEPVVTVPPMPTVAIPPTEVPPLITEPEPSASPVGRWEDPDSNAPYSITTIDEQNGEYVVVAVTNEGRGNVNELTWSQYVNGVLTWEYCPEGMYCITSEFVSVTEDSLTANWYWSDDPGNGDTTIFRRAP